MPLTSGIAHSNSEWQFSLGIFSDKKAKWKLHILDVGSLAIWWKFILFSFGWRQYMRDLWIEKIRQWFTSLSILNLFGCPFYCPWSHRLNIAWTDSWGIVLEIVLANWAAFISRDYIIALYGEYFLLYGAVIFSQTDPTYRYQRKIVCLGPTKIHVQKLFSPHPPKKRENEKNSLRYNDNFAFVMCHQSKKFYSEFQQKSKT